VAQWNTQRRASYPEGIYPLWLLQMGCSTLTPLSATSPQFLYWCSLHSSTNYLAYSTTATLRTLDLNVTALFCKKADDKPPKPGTTQVRFHDVLNVLSRCIVSKANMNMGNIVIILTGAAFTVLPTPCILTIRYALFPHILFSLQCSMETTHTMWYYWHSCLIMSWNKIFFLGTYWCLKSWSIGILE